ncbi:kinase-like domain-containing protein [Daedaleopsis nitida]|nr:kinase-like domain-containing protein [Daedaleopsis nitida]
MSSDIAIGDGEASLPSWAAISHLSDEQLRMVFYTSAHKLPSPIVNSVDVRRIATDAVMRLGPAVYDSEILTMRLVSQSSSIPVPTIRRIVKVGDSQAIIMDYIPGETLGTCWSRLSYLQRIRIIWTLRGYIRQLRGIRVPNTLSKTVFPGPIASEPRRCHGPMFTEYGAGPFASYNELTAWFMHKLDVNRSITKYPPGPMTFDASLPLVLTHLDIHPDNVILGDDGRVWLIDWELAGLYPQWFEYVGMVGRWDMFGRWERLVLRFIAGFYERQLRFIGSITWSLNTGAFL